MTTPAQSCASECVFVFPWYILSVCPSVCLSSTSTLFSYPQHIWRLKTKLCRFFVMTMRLTCFIKIFTTPVYCLFPDIDNFFNSRTQSEAPDQVQVPSHASKKRSCSQQRDTNLGTKYDTFTTISYASQTKLSFPRSLWLTTPWNGIGVSMLTFYFYFNGFRCYCLIISSKINVWIWL